MINHQIEKRALEKWAVEWFLRHYNVITGKEFQLICQQERPDAIIQASDESALGLEIAHLFYDSLEAKMLLGRSDTWLHEIENFEELIKRLNEILRKKEEKGRTYSCLFPVSLLIRSASPVFTGPEFLKISDRLEVPQGIYEAVWLLAKDNDMKGWPYLIRLDK